LISVAVGALFVAACAYIAAVFLVADARRLGDTGLTEYFRRRALGAALVAGVLAIAGIVALHDDARYVFDGLTAEGLPLVILSASAVPPRSSCSPAVRHAESGRSPSARWPPSSGAAEWPSIHTSCRSR
jgi:hypothetical protein